MNCLKCGRETDQTFCDQCREVMEKYPVKPGSYVLLPKRNRTVKRTPPRRDGTPPEVRIARLRRVIRRMALAIAALILMLASAVYAVYRFWQERDVRPVGQNYSTVTKPSEEPNNDETAQST